MNRSHFFLKLSRVTSAMIVLIVLFFAIGKPIFALGTVNSLADVVHQEEMATANDFHLLMNNGPKVSSDAGMPDGHTMICCVEGEQPFPVPGNPFSKFSTELGFVSGDINEDSDIFTSCVLLYKSPPPRGEITLRSQCQRE